MIPADSVSRQWNFQSACSIRLGMWMLAWGAWETWGAWEAWEEWREWGVRIPVTIGISRSPLRGREDLGDDVVEQVDHRHQRRMRAGTPEQDRGGAPRPRQVRLESSPVVHRHHRLV